MARYVAASVPNSRRSLINGTRLLSGACKGCPAAASGRTVSAVRQTIGDGLALCRTVVLTKGRERTGFSRVDADNSPHRHTFCPHVPHMDKPSATRRHHSTDQGPLWSGSALWGLAS